MKKNEKKSFTDSEVENEITVDIDDTVTEEKKAKPKKEKKIRLSKSQKELKKLKEENAELKDKLLRSMAEFENFRNRTSKEISAIISRANGNLIEKILPIITDCERSFNQEVQDENEKKFIEGFRMIFNKLMSVLQDTGLKEMESDNTVFNPEIHEALMQVENKDVPSNHIVETFEKGYFINDKVIKPAKVIVSK